MRNKIKVILVLIIGLVCIVSCSKDNEIKFGIKKIEAFPQKLGSNETSYLIVTMEKEYDDLYFEWVCSGGEFQWESHSSNVIWLPPLEDGDYNIEVTVTKGSKECYENIILTVSGLFFDDFTGGLGRWETTLGESWIENDMAYLTGSYSNYYGTLESDMSPNIFLPYSLNVTIGRNSEFYENEHYGFCIDTDDNGTPRIHYLSFFIYPSYDSFNWLAGCYIEDDYEPEWYILEDESTGIIDESLIEIGDIQNIEWIFEEDKSLTIKLNGITIYSSTIITDMETMWEDEIGIKLDAIDFRTTGDKEMFIDHVIVIDPTGIQRAISGKELHKTGKNNNFNLSKQKKCDIDLNNKPTIRELFLK